MLNTVAKIGEEFLEAERLRHNNPGENLQIAVNQFKKLCRIRGRPIFSEAEQTYMHAVVTKAKKDRVQAVRSRPVNENKMEMNRNIITSADLQELLKVCAVMPDRLTAARAKALILVNVLTGEPIASQSWLTSDQRRCFCIFRPSGLSEVSSAEPHCSESSSNCSTAHNLPSALTRLYFSSSAASKVSSTSRLLSSCTTSVEFGCAGWSECTHCCAAFDRGPRLAAFLQPCHHRHR